MAVHLNLFHEIAKRKALKRRDPLKLSMYGIGVVAAMMAGFYVLQLAESSSASSDLRRTEQELEKLKPQVEAGLKEEEELSNAIKTSEAMVKRIEGRFYWANVLQEITDSTPRDIQITRLIGEIGSDAPRPGTVTVEGIAAGLEPRKVAEELRLTLAERFGKTYKRVSAAFTLLDDGKDQITIQGKPLPTAVFTIRLGMQLMAEETPATPPKSSKRAAVAASGEKP